MSFVIVTLILDLRSMLSIMIGSKSVKICNYSDSHFLVAVVKFISLLLLFSNLNHEPSKNRISFQRNRHFEAG